MKKHSRNKNRFINRLTPYVKPFLAVVLVFGVAVSLMHKQSAHAASDRAKTATGIIFGGGAGAAIAGIAGSAKWFPLGFGVGVAGSLLVRRIIKNRRRRAENPASYEPRQRRRRSRYHMQENQTDYQPTAVQRRHIKMNNNY